MNTPHPPKHAPDMGTLRVGNGESEQICAVPREERDCACGSGGSDGSGNVAVVTGHRCGHRNDKAERGLKIFLGDGGGG